MRQRLGGVIAFSACESVEETASSPQPSPPEEEREIARSRPSWILSANQGEKATGTGGRFRHMLFDLLCNTKLLTGLVTVCSNFIFQKLLFRLGLLNDLLEQVDVIGKSLFAGGSQRASGQRPIVLEGFGDRNVACFLKCADVGGKIPICHIEKQATFRSPNPSKTIGR